MTTTSALDHFLSARRFLLAHREDYETAYRDFQWPQLDEFNWALDYFDRLGREEDGTALRLVSEDGDEKRLTFSQLSRQSNQTANYLRGLGVQRGDRVLVMLNNVVPLWETLLACMKLGAVVIPATTQLTPDDLTDRIERGGVNHVVARAQDAEKFDEVPGSYSRIAVPEADDTSEAPEGWHSVADAEEESADFEAGGATHACDPLLLYFTSGTTSQPKLVSHTHASYPVGHLSTMYWIGLQPGDVHWNISSPGWAKHAWSCFFAPWNAGATVFVYRYDRFQAKRALELIVRCGVTSLCAPPTVWRLFIQEDLSSYSVNLRELVAAGEPLNPEIISKVRAAWDLTIRDGYGQTETTAQVGNSPGQPVKLGSMGRPMPGYTVDLLGPNGKQADEGEVCLSLDERPLGLMEGYQDDSALTEEVMRDRYYHTRDVATRDEDGYYWYVGRTDDVFKSSDYRISPFELESALIEHDAVAEAAVVPSPHPVRLSVPKAFVSLAKGYEPGEDEAREILAFARRRLTPYKRVRRLEFAELPKTISGKIRRVELRAREENRDGLQAREADTGAPSRRDLEFWEEDFPELKESED